MDTTEPKYSLPKHLVGTLQGNLRSLFQSVFWPAAAGNVFWSACAMLVDENVDPLSSEALSRMTVLVVLSAYLSVEWLRNYGRLPAKVSWRFWLADWLHVCAVVFVALSAAVRHEWLVIAGVSYFTITALGHFFGAWEAVDAAAADRKALGFINLFGVAILVVGQCAGAIWHIAIGFLVVVSLWVAYRKQEIRDLFTN